VPSLNDPAAGCAATATAIIPDRVFSTPAARYTTAPHAQAGRGHVPTATRAARLVPKKVDPLHPCGCPTSGGVRPARLDIAQQIDKLGEQEVYRRR
jgi:hypothetical protein